MTRPAVTYRVYAVRYAHRERRSSGNFLGGDTHDVAMPLDYFVWAIVGGSRAWIVDTGFDQAGAAKRKRAILRPIEQGLGLLGVDTTAVQDVVITHMHYDHAGNRDLFPQARYHLQDQEMAFCTGRCMCHRNMAVHFDADDVASMVHKVFSGRVAFHDGDDEIAPGITVHHMGGHTPGMQVVRVHTEKGWMVLASDAAHYYANIEQDRPFPALVDVAASLEAYKRIYALADAPELVIPGHDPLVMQRFPNVHEGVARLDTGPR